ncbi:MAG: flagellar hook-associated protein FlgL [Oceanococcus sp.]
MRVTQSMLYRQTLQTMQQREGNALQRQNEIASGIRLNQAMDDPAAMGRVMRNDDSQQLLLRYADNIRGVESRLGFVESELDGVTDLLHRGRELMVAGANATQSEESLAAIANELRSLGEAMIQIGNGRDGQGRYLFAGHDDSSPAFVAAGTSYSYDGGTAARQIPIDNSTSMASGLVGDQVFLNGPAGDMFALFNDLADDLQQATTTPAEVAQRQSDIDAGLNRLDDALGHVLSVRTGLGVDLQRLATASERIDVLSVELQSDTSTLRDTDLPQAISELSQEMTLLEVARKTFVQIQGLSLFNFLR